MGKGDKKTRRGKITAGSYGKLRKRKSSVPAMAEKPAKVKAVEESSEPKPKKVKAEKTEETSAEEQPKKTTRKKKTEE